MKRFGMIAIALALGAPALALAQPAARSGGVDTRRIETGRTLTPARDIVVDRRDATRIARPEPNIRRRPDDVDRRRAHDPNRRRWYEPNRRRLHEPNRRRFQDHGRRRAPDSAGRRGS